LTEQSEKKLKLKEEPETKIPPATDEAAEVQAGTHSLKRGFKLQAAVQYPDFRIILSPAFPLSAVASGGKYPVTVALPWRILTAFLHPATNYFKRLYYGTESSARQWLSFF
jgi:hypothetical protein